MVRLKTPLLSMDAHGTVGNAVTFQSSTRRKFAREKPDLPYSLTLPQRYQRWLYEDYCAYWHTLTATQKNVYRDAGHRFHRTAFQQFMSSMLAELPDIAGMWHLDEETGAIATDFSRNGNDGVVFGASFVEGLIDYALLFDGVNDYVSCPHSSSLSITSLLTIEFFINPVVLATAYLVSKRLPSFGAISYLCQLNAAGTPAFVLTLTTGAFSITFTSPLVASSWSHLAFTYDGAFMRGYRNGVLDPSTPHTGTIVPNVAPVDLAAYQAGALYRLDGILDHLIIYNRALSEADILRHSKRRYQA